MTLRNWMRALGMALLAAGFFAGGAAAGDFVDVRVWDLEVIGPGPTIKEGETLQVGCTWSLSLADGHLLWHADQEQRFPVRISIDGQPIGSGEGVIVMGTELKREEDSFFSGPTFYTPLEATVKAVWSAKGVGVRTVQCVVNEPKQISDHHKHNNRKSIQVEVVPNYDKVQPGGAWPTKAPPDLGGTSRRPSSVAPAPAEPPAEAEGAPSGGARRRLPKSGADPAPTIPDPPPELPRGRSR